MSFGGFKFGSSSSSAPASTAPPTVPSFSLTGATPTMAAPQTQTPQQGFSFGSSQPQPQQNAGTQTPPGSSAGMPGGSGFFGNLGQNQSQGQGQQPQQGVGGGGLFGGSSLLGANPAQSGQPAAGANTGTGGLFGGSSLFGNQQQQQQQQQQPQQQNSLFGQSTGQQQPQQSSLFGQPATQPQRLPQSSLFGGTHSANQQPTSSLFGGQSQPQTLQNSVFQGSTSSVGSSGVNKSTKFTDLPENVQKTIEQLEMWITQQKQMGSEINTEGLGRAIWQTSGDVKAATEETSAVAQSLASLQASLTQLRDKFISEEEDLRKIAEIWEMFKSVDGRPGAVRVAAHRDFPQDFFSRAAASMQERVGRYKKTITQLQRVVVSLSSEHETQSPQAIAQTIQNHQNAILTFAAQIEQLHLRLNTLRGIFAEDYRERTNSMRDPFNVAREEKGLPPVRS